MTDTSPPIRPVIVLPDLPVANHQPRGGGRQNTSRPTRGRQGERLDGRFDELDRLLTGASSATVTTELPEGDPELVVVFEVIDSTQDLAGAFVSVGLEPLVDVEDGFEEDEIDLDFRRLRPRTEASEPVKRFLHAGMANEEAMRQLLRLWNHWKTGARMIRGYGPFTSLFNQLYDVRPWGPADRVRSTGLDLLVLEAIELNSQAIPVNVELWYRVATEKRQLAESNVRSVIAASGGQVLSSAVYAEIGYHALAAEIPASSMGLAVLDGEVALLNEVDLLRSPEVLFVRPGGQRVGTHIEDELIGSEAESFSFPVREPLLAVLDGLPATNHPVLQNRLEVLDSDDVASDPLYTVERRRHGSMVVSAAIWGDRGQRESPTDRRVVVRPVLRPDPQTHQMDEAVPWSELPADLTIRSVRDVVAEFPSVRVINVSLGDPLAQFDTIPTAWARAIDWLAYELNLLFVVSAGNYGSSLPIDEDELRSATAEERDRLTASTIGRLSPGRRLLPPAEALNALTVGAIHDDAAGDPGPLGYRLDPWSRPGNVSPVSAHGRGIRRAIKPDLVAPGGRQLYLPKRPGYLEPHRATARPPGIMVAAPPDKEAYVCGTTFAAVEVSRRAVRIMDSLEAGSQDVLDRHRPVAAKALLVHGTSFSDETPYGVPADRVLGHGAIDRDLADGCRSTQATLLATGDIAGRQQVEVAIPFPEMLASATEIRRVTMTLAWFSPINWNHRQYRRAKLQVNGPPEIRQQTRTSIGPDYRLTQRGSIQHRVFETGRAFSATDLTLTVTCADQAGGFDGTVPFALAVTLETGTGSSIDVYDQVLAQVRTRVRLR